MVRVAQERTALSLEYEQKVKAVYTAYAALGSPRYGMTASRCRRAPRRAARMAGKV